MSVIETFVKRVHEENSTELAKWLRELANSLINQLDHKLNFLVEGDLVEGKITYKFSVLRSKRRNCYSNDSLYSEYVLFTVDEYLNGSYYLTIDKEIITFHAGEFNLPKLKDYIEKEFETNGGWVMLVRSLLLKEED